MNRKEASSILAKELASYRHQSYKRLLRLLDEQDTIAVKGRSGVSYQLEFHAIWDDRTRGHLRVCGSIDDSGWRAFAPVTEDFIVAAEGTFIGE